MKSFLKSFFASCLGIMVGMLFIILIGISIVVSLTNNNANLTEPAPRSIMLIQLPYQIEERSPELFENISIQQPLHNVQLGLHDIIHAIHHAQHNDQIEGILLDVSRIQAGYASIQEIRQALTQFQQSGKFIVAHSDMFLPHSYYLSSVANQLYITPNGIFQWNGLVAQSIYFKELLKKMDIEMQIITGPDNFYKSAVESFSRDHLSPANKAQLTPLINAMWNTLSGDIASSRQITVEAVNQIAQSGSLGASQLLIEQGFIDGFMYKDEVMALLKERTNTQDEEDLPVISIEKYHLLAQKNPPSGDKQPSIAIVYATGEMMLGKSSPGTMGSETLRKTIRDIREDEQIAAMVLRINSGGGSALAAEIIWREVALCQAKKPVIVSMGDYAASGAYYIAAPADRIVCNPLTVTGSIGVYGMLPNLEQFFHNKLGISFDQVKNYPYADMLSPNRPLSVQEKEIFQAFITRTYNTFKLRVEKGRSLSPEQVENIAKGRIWPASLAQTHHLVDTLGDLSDALQIAAKMTNLEEYHTIELPKKPNFFEMLKQELSYSYLRYKSPEQFFGKQYFPVIQHMQNKDFIMTRMPVELEFR